MNSIQEKIQKNSKVMAIVLKVISISLIIGICVPVAFLIWIAVKPDVNITSIAGLDIYAATGQALTSTGEVIAEMCTIIVSGILVLRMFIKAYRMLNSISKEAAPFSKSNVNKIKGIGTLLLVYAFVVPIARAGFYRSFAPTINTKTSFDVSFVLLALMFFFIATVFDYGAELQRESDELL